MRSESPDQSAPRGLSIAAWAVIAFLHLPVLVIVLYAFASDDRTYTFPPPGLTLHWFSVAASRLDMWAALLATAAGAVVIKR